VTALGTTQLVGTLAASVAVGLAAALWGGRPERRLGGPRRIDSFGLLRRISVSAARWSRVAVPSGLVVALLLIGPMAIVPSVVLAGGGCVYVRRRHAARSLRIRQLQDRDDVQALRALAAELRSGLPPPDALRAAAGGGSAHGLRKRMLAAAVADKLGGDPAQSLGIGASAGSPAAGIAAAWAVCQVTGAGLAAPVTRIADAAASGLLLAREADAALASARSSARLLAVLPVAGVAIGVLSGTGSVRVLLATNPGQLCLLLGSALELAGLVWLDRLAGTAG
jgi:tight adherence protein B